MIYISDIRQLTDKWTERMNNPAQSFDYRNALSECVYELNQLINKTLLDQMTEEDARDYILSQEVDSYISCEENYYATAI